MLGGYLVWLGFSGVKLEATGFIEIRARVRPSALETWSDVLFLVLFP
jgi:hypothetical protein